MVRHRARAAATAYDVIGNSSAPAVVLIHGLGLCRAMWDDHVEALAEHFCVVRYDLYGHGDSGCCPPATSASVAGESADRRGYDSPLGDRADDERAGTTGARAQITLSAYAQQIASLLDELSIERAHLVGFSIGGMINRRFAMDFAARTASLIILNSPHHRGEELQREVEQRALQVRASGPMATMENALARWFTQDFRVGNAAILSKVRGWRERVDSESYAQAAWVLAAGVPQLVNLRRAISAPALVMTCAGDSGSTPAMSEAIACEIEGARLRIVPKLQHLGVLEQPAIFTAAMVEFLLGATGEFT